jgi:DNA-binding MarR family transcriptional regulator
MDNAGALALWKLVLADTVRTEGPDLSARQAAILLTVQLEEGPHTVRGLAAQLKLGKPAVTRALDTLEGLGFVRRRRDETDRRNVLIERTARGLAFLANFADRIRTCERTLRDKPPQPMPQAPQPHANGNGTHGARRDAAA